MFLLHGLKTADIWFFVICAIAVAVIVIIYFLIPVFKRKQFAEARKNLARREILFKQNQKKTQAEEISVDEEALVEEAAEAKEASVEPAEIVIPEPIIAAEEVQNTTESQMEEALEANEADAEEAKKKTKKAPAEK